MVAVVYLCLPLLPSTYQLSLQKLEAKEWHHKTTIVQVKKILLHFRTENVWTYQVVLLQDSGWHIHAYSILCCFYGIQLHGEHFFSDLVGPRPRSKNQDLSPKTWRLLGAPGSAREKWWVLSTSTWHILRSYRFLKEEEKMKWLKACWNKIVKQW